MYAIGSWVTSQERWLCRLYGKDGDNGTRQLPPSSVQAQMLNVVRDIVSGTILPKDAAERTSSLMMSQADVGCVQNLIGIFYGAVEIFEDERISQALDDFIVALASLPDAINHSHEPKVVDVGGGQTVFLQPGETMTIEGQAFWRDLPYFSMNLTERFQG